MTGRGRESEMFPRERTRIPPSLSLSLSAIRSYHLREEAFPNLEWRRVVGRPRGNEILQPFSFLPTVERADFIRATPFIPLARRFDSRIHDARPSLTPLSLCSSLFAPRGQRSSLDPERLYSTRGTVCRLTDKPVQP